MQEPILGQRVLSRLVRNLGGEEQAARRLNISLIFLRAYLAGERPVPERVWLQAVDALMVELARVPPPGS